VDLQCVGGGGEESRSVLDAGRMGAESPLIGATRMGFRGGWSVGGPARAPPSDGLMRRRHPYAWRAVPREFSTPG
jgi:hypothetical protein